MNGDIWRENPISGNTAERIAHKLYPGEVFVRSVSIRLKESDLVPDLACHTLYKPLLEINEGA